MTEIIPKIKGTIYRNVTRYLPFDVRLKIRGSKPVVFCFHGIGEKSYIKNLYSSHY